jgi:hypothetical protein
MAAVLDGVVGVWRCEEQHVSQRADTQDPDGNEYQKHACFPLIQPTTVDAACVHVSVR